FAKRWASATMRTSSMTARSLPPARRRRSSGMTASGRYTWAVNSVSEYTRLYPPGRPAREAGVSSTCCHEAVPPVKALSKPHDDAAVAAGDPPAAALQHGTADRDPGGAGFQ